MEPTLVADSAPALADQPVVADGAITPAPIGPDVAAQRATKAKMGIASLDMSPDQLTQMFQQGNEDQVREMAADKLNQMKRERKLDILNAVAKQKGGPLLPEEVGAVYTKIRELDKDTNPQSVFEEYYSQAYTNLISKVAQSMPDSDLNKALTQHPEESDSIRLMATKFLAMKEIKETALQNLQAQEDGQSWTQYLWDWNKYLTPFGVPSVVDYFRGQSPFQPNNIVTDLIPGRVNYQLRNAVPGGAFFEGGPLRSQNLNAQLDRLNRMSLDEFANVYPKVIEGLRKSDPRLAKEFAEASLGQSTQDEALKNLGDTIDLTMVKPFALIKFAGKFGERMTAEKLLSSVNKTVVDGLDAAMKPQSTTADIHESMGDLRTAAVQRATDNLVLDATGKSDPTTRNLEAIAAVFNRAIDTFKANTGNLDRELVNRIVGGYETARDQLVNAMTNNLRVDRIPAVMQTRETLDRIAEDAKLAFPGLDNTVLDVSTPYRDPVTNGLFVRVFFGKNDGTLYGNLKDATTFRNQKGLSNIGAVGKDEEGVFVKKAPKPSTKGVWKNADTDLPVDIVKEAPSAGSDGRMYQKVKYEGKESYVPVDELTYPGETEGPVQKGAGYYVHVDLPIDETGHIIRDSLITTENTKTPSSRVNALIGFVRTPGESLSKDAYQNRLVATVAPSNFLNIINESSKDLSKLASWSNILPNKRRKWNDFKRMIEDQESAPFDARFDDPVQLQNYYLRTFNRSADNQEVAAYFAYRRAEDMFDVFRNVTSLSKKTRLGEMNYTFKALDPTLETQGSSGFKQVAIDGKRLSSSAEAGEDTMLILGDNVGQESLVNSTRYFATKAGKLLTKEIDAGTKVLVQISEPANRPFQGFGVVGDQRVRYVVADAAEAKNLEFDQIKGMARPARDTYEHYVAQANVRLDNTTGHYWYERDNKLFGDNIRARAQEVARKLDMVRLSIKAGNYAEAEANNPIADGFDTVRGWFEGPNARLNLDEPIRVVPRGKNIGELDTLMKDRYNALDPKKPDVFRDGTHEGYGRYFPNGDVHELYSYERTGTWDRPMYSVMPATKVDPLRSLNRSLNGIVNDLYLDDYKIFSVEHWIQEAKTAGILDVSANKLADSPYYYFWTAQEHMLKGADDTLKKNALLAQYQIRQFLGITDETQNWLHSATQSLADSIFTKGHERLALAPAYLLPKLRDPASFIRSITFHWKLGLLSPSQIITQSQTFANIWGIAGPKYAAPGTKAALLHQYSRWNASPEILDALDKIATQQIIPGTSRYLPGEWKEAREWGLNTGWFNVGAEHAVRANDFSANAITMGIQDKVLNPLAVFFTEGERGVRLGAWYTAFKEFRDANPTRAITSADIRDILYRADMFNANMTRAANSRIQQGLLSPMSQFQTYQMRIAEQMWGKRLTANEKMRMATVYSALYGVPGALGLSGLPIGDIINQKLKDDGYNVGQDAVADLINKGIPETLMGYISGKVFNAGQHGEGLWYDVQGRYGVQGLEPLREMLKSDPDFLKIIGGAGYSTFGNTLAAMYPFWNFVTAFARDDNKTLRPTMDNFLDIWREISTVNNFTKTLTALNTGKLFSKNQNYQYDVTAPNAIFQFLSGLSPQQISDAFTLKDVSNNFQEHLNEGVQKYIREMRRGFQAEKDGNPDQANTFYRNAKAYQEMYDFPREKRMDYLSMALKGYESYVNNMNRNFYTKGVPASKTQRRIQSYQNLLRQGR